MDMNINRTLFPSLFFATLAIIGITNLISAPTIALAAPQEVFTEPTATPQPSSTAVSGSQDCPISSRYPDSIRQWCSLITTSAAKYELEPDLLAAVMLQESGGNPGALSKSGAVGLMQIMARDGKAAEYMCKNGPCFAKRPSMEELYDPAFNMDYGARMLAGLIGRHGSVRDALKAYGPMDVGYSYADIVLTIQENYR
jgi:soluble lytic murein transglycosylase-like protein